MPYSHVAVQAHHVACVEHVAHQAVVLAQVQAFAFAGNDACCVLPAVLQYSQSVVDSLIDWTVGNHADDAAHMYSSKAVRRRVN